MLAGENRCGGLSWLLFDVGGPSPLWELPPLKTWTWLYKKASSASASELVFKQHPLEFQLQFLDWEQVSWLEVILHGIAGKPAFGFLLELLHWLLSIMDSGLQAEINPFPPLWRFWSECSIPATARKPEHWQHIPNQAASPALTGLNLSCVTGYLHFPKKPVKRVLASGTSLIK